MEVVKTLRLNQFLKANEEAFFYANTIQDHLLDNHIHIDKPHKHEFYSTYLFVKGDGVHEIDFRNHLIKPGSVFFMSPGQVHNWELSEEVEGYVFFHSLEFYDLHYVQSTIKKFSFFGSLSATKCFYLSTEQLGEFELLFQKIKTEADGNDAHKSAYILSLITQVYIEMSRLINKQQGGELEDFQVYSHHFERFEQLLEKHFKEIKSPAVYAEMMNMTTKHLNRIVKSSLNKTTHELISSRVILEAKRMLMHTDSNFNEIAYQLGYEDYPHFSKIFKKIEGLTPSEFIKSYNLT